MTNQFCIMPKILPDVYYQHTVKPNPKVTNDLIQQIHTDCKQKEQKYLALWHSTSQGR